MSTAFDKVLHTGLSFKLKSFRESGDLLKLIKNLLNNKFQGVSLNDQTSDWLALKAGALQRSLVGPLFFLIYIKTYQMI